MSTPTKYAESLLCLKSVENDTNEVHRNTCTLPVTHSPFCLTTTTINHTHLYMLSHTDTHRHTHTHAKTNYSEQNHSMEKTQYSLNC